ncbi:N-terminal C2 in EEIG1 and EHBP1 proteins-domain-containing protein [Daedaleopsis nitida]|nr:N-terminal C2 in EEIG1 and EHBP1 proteins-domain-containing protein [Daedaleopsis nitida]
MKQNTNTTASTSSSGASSSTPNPSSHGLRTQLGHLIPRHALFQVHVHIDQLSNVPLIKGEFGVRWKFKNVQSGSGLLSKMKGNRSWSGQSRGKGADRELGSGSAGTGGEDGGMYDEPEDDIEGDSTHDTTEDDHSAAHSPRSPRIPNGSSDALETAHPPPTPTPIINGHTNSSTSVSRSEARGMTPWAHLQSYNVKWEHSVNVVVQMDVHRETGDLLPNELRLVVMQRVVSGDPDAPQQPRLGAVHLNLAEYADAGQVTRRYLLRQSKINATLKLTVELEHIGGEKHYKPPPLRKGEILASVSGLLSNNGIFNTRFARELDLYVGADKPEEENAFPYSDQRGHVQADRLANSYGLRTTEHLIEALFNPVPSDSSDQTPFTYYAPPQMERSNSLEDDDNDASNSNGRRSMDSSVGSASYVASTSEHSSFDPGMATDAPGLSSNRHWWQKMRSRPSTPATRTTFRPSTPAPPVPVRH